ncbi:MarR family winged helix-turn-helix transcriptional regulator [Brevundimonas sp. R86498]|uniref:MarR family winged helix-turn-helix transcriptional regulator n=1 Tax=Brevundimonas sp. R86498 TaxID=3093845 RepID=UPI0037CB95F9
MIDHVSPTDWTGYLLNVVAARLRDATAVALSPWNLSPRDLGVLTTLASGSGLSQIALGRLIGMDRSSMVQLADRLEAQGWIQRRPDPADRRVNLLVLSESGADRLAAAAAAARAAETACLTALSPDQIDTLRTLLRQVVTG